jgi:dipeptidyl aminopeptidase/acylaminoacyl peptidase
VTILLAILGILVLAALAMLAASINLMHQTTRPKGKRRTTYEQARSWVSANTEEDMFSWHDSAKKEPFKLMSQGVELNCEYIPPANGSEVKKCLIRAHGYTQNMMLSVAYARAFHNAGYGVIIYDQRAFGNSGGKVCSLGWKERLDMVELVKWARSKLGEDTFIGLHGESMGAITALEAAPLIKNLGFVIADSAPDNALNRFGETDQHSMPKEPTRTFAKLLGRLMGADLSQIDPISRLDSIDAPIMFIHGDADKAVPVECSRLMFAKANGRPWRLSIFEGAQHVWNILVDTKRHEREVIEFANEAQKIWAEKQ